MAKDWSDREVKNIVTDYFKMLSLEIRDIKYNKSAHRRELLETLDNRNESAIEFKHRNISAVLIKYGRPYINGYKPLFGFQKSLEIIILKSLEAEIILENDFDFFTKDAQIEKPNQINFNSWIEEIPPLMKFEELETEYKIKISKVDFLKIEQANRKLGLLGEELAIDYEKWRLIENGKEKLAEAIEWVSKDYGDGAGFDILSKNLNGTDRYIEVKTTKSGKFTPIYFTRNELKFSQKNEQNYYLYRVFEFKKNPRMFNSNGSLNSICHMEPLSYIGKFK